MRGLVEVRQNFISEEEENALFKEVEPGLRKKRYEFDHWDDVSKILLCFCTNAKKRSCMCCTTSIDTVINPPYSMI